MSVTVITRATNRRLTTPARARTMLGFASSPAVDAKLGMLIDSVSQEIVGACGREFALDRVREVFGWCGVWGETALDRDPVVSIASVTLDGALLVPTTDFTLQGQELIRWRGGRRTPWSGRSLAVEYDAGYTLPSDDEGATWTLPPVVEMAAILVIGSRMASAGRDPNLRSENVQGVGSFSYGAPGAATKGPLGHAEAEAMLQPFERPVIA